SESKNLDELNSLRKVPMKDDNQNIYFSLALLRNRITNRLIPLFFVTLLISLTLSLERIPMIGFRPLMSLHIFLMVMMAILFVARYRIRPDLSVLIMIAMLSSVLIIGVATLGLLSASFVLSPIIAMYLMLLGHRKSAYISIVITCIYLIVMGILFISGIFGSTVSPDLYVRTPIAWMIMVVSISGVSIAFVVPFEMVPGALERSEEQFRL